MSHDGIDTTRERSPSASSFSCASTARLTSLPVAMRITSGFPPWATASTYAPRATPDAGAYLVRSKVGSGWRDRANTAGSWRTTPPFDYLDKWIMAMIGHKVNYFGRSWAVQVLDRSDTARIDFGDKVERDDVSTHHPVWKVRVFNRPQLSGAKSCT